VWIKKRMCQIANSKFKVKGHKHIRYHMVEELPEFDKVKKMQTVMQQLMDSSVLKRQAVSGQQHQQPLQPSVGLSPRAGAVDPMQVADQSVVTHV
jgi:hypothetical protein